MTNFGSGFRIKVSPDQMIRTADNVSNLVKEMRAAYEEMNGIVSGTGLYWKGLAGDTRRRIYNEKKETAEQMLKYLDTYPTDLLKMAGVYAETEAANAQAPDALSSDIII